ncbi:MAG TPA: DUF58 domain-containing protein [Steroidobacteraceae bacterium]|jgi:uncharacterized protein (DUF58 family)|nr:DUF58 domain-containing protein [Steroidobacteraceae bacterium]
MSGASLRGNAFLLVLAAAAAAIAGDWSGDASLAGLWRFPAALLLLGLAYESWIVSRSRLVFELQAPERLYLGRAAPFRFACRHALDRTLTLEVAPVAPDYFDAESQVERLMVASGARASIERRVIPCRLGEHDWRQVNTRIAGPLGLAWWPSKVACTKTLKVVPDLFRSAAEVRTVSASGSQAGLDSGAGAEVLRLREYRSGDPPRVIDWKATVRAGRLISRDFSQDHGLQIVILIDAGRSSSLRAGSLDRFGHYVNVAARLAQFAVEREDLVGLILYADRPLATLAPARGAGAVVRLRALLAAARVERSESNPLYAATRVRSLVRHRSLIVLLTDVDDASAKSQLTQAVRFLLPKHLPFVAGLSSAAVESLARAPARQWLDPYRSLAAQEYCIGLERKVRALNALGAPALVARPEQLERAVFAAYASFQRLRRA